MYSKVIQLFFRFFFIIGCYKTLNMVPYAKQWVLVYLTHL